MFASSGFENAENAETSTPVLTAGRRRGVFFFNFGRSLDFRRRFLYNKSAGTLSPR
jgi:hypothetical protein